MIRSFVFRSDIARTCYIGKETEGWTLEVQVTEEIKLHEGWRNTNGELFSGFRGARAAVSTVVAM